MNHFNLSHAIIGLLGILLIINTIFVLIYPKYYSRLSKPFFFEPISNKQKEHVQKFIKNTENTDRYITSIVCVGLAMTAIAWALGKIQSITFPFFSITAIMIISRYLLKDKNAK